MELGTMTAVVSTSLRRRTSLLDAATYEQEVATGFDKRRCATSIAPVNWPPPPDLPKRRATRRTGTRRLAVDGHELI
jgi:hypothetical protein